MGIDGVPFMYNMTGLSRTCSAIKRKASSAWCGTGLRFAAKSEWDPSSASSSLLLEERKRRVVVVVVVNALDEDEDEHGRPLVKVLAEDADVVAADGGSVNRDDDVDDMGRSWLGAADSFVVALAMISKEEEDALEHAAFIIIIMTTRYGKGRVVPYFMVL
jgi:hypothetical protein